MEQVSPEKALVVKSLTGHVRYWNLAMNPLRKNPKSTVEKKAPRNPSQVFFGDSLIRGVRPKKNPKK
jgi:hypothetical protein